MNISMFLEALSINISGEHICSVTLIMCLLIKIVKRVWHTRSSENVVIFICEYFKKKKKAKFETFIWRGIHFRMSLILSLSVFLFLFYSSSLKHQTIWNLLNISGYFCYISTQVIGWNEFFFFSNGIINCLCIIPSDNNIKTFHCVTPSIIYLHKTMESFMLHASPSLVLYHSSQSSI